MPDTRIEHCECMYSDVIDVFRGPAHQMLEVVIDHEDQEIRIYRAPPDWPPLVIVTFDGRVEFPH